MGQTIRIEYGQQHHVEMSELLGEDSRSIRPIDTFDLFGTYRSYYCLQDGRYAIVTTTQYGHSSGIQIFADREEYETFRHNDMLLSQDPENRGGRNTYSQKIRWVRRWMAENPGKRVPTNYKDAPELWHYDYNCPKCREGKELHVEGEIEVTATQMP